MMTTVRIESADVRSLGAVVEVYQRGVGGQADTLVETRFLGRANNTAEWRIGATRLLVVREPTEAEAKSIDNWATAAPVVPEPSLPPALPES
jgi:hypothetical protein